MTFFEHFSSDNDTEKKQKKTADNDVSSEKKASGFPTFSTHNDVSKKKLGLSEFAFPGVLGRSQIDLPTHSPKPTYCPKAALYTHTCK